MSELLLRADGLGKKYTRSLRRSISYGMRDVVAEALGTRKTETLREDEFWALRDVSFELRRGECLAVIGGNGAGKSTLLKTLSGILSPDRGTIERNGRIEKMIELSSGMSPTLTGRQNVALRCRLLGLSKRETAQRLEEVVAFAELGEFIDSPVKYYSSGMKARLGFATTVVMSPDILIIDEVLAVGDLGFRMKCYERVDEMRRSSAVVLVTHGMNHVSRMATSCLVMHKGRPAYMGSTQGGIACYQELVGSKSPAKVSSHNPELIEFRMLCNGVPLDGDVVNYGDVVSLVGTHKHHEPLHMCFLLHESNGPTIADWHSKRSGFLARSSESFRLDVGPAELCPGYYQWVAVGMAADGTQHFLSPPLRFKVNGLHLGTTRLQPMGAWSVDDGHASRQLA
ncbi:MAG: ABC transporter ATP-binding protein [Thermomonas sp.]|uniref:ABC transporter ATP-binding protein n=1 Tax=Thermomonas sp. TaxID=1971895 RepID=UPI0039E63879